MTSSIYYLYFFKITLRIVVYLTYVCYNFCEYRGIMSEDKIKNIISIITCAIMGPVVLFYAIFDSINNSNLNKNIALLIFGLIMSIFFLMYLYFVVWKERDKSKKIFKLDVMVIISLIIFTIFLIIKYPSSFEKIFVGVLLGGGVLFTFIFIVYRLILNGDFHKISTIFLVILFGAFAISISVYFMYIPFKDNHVSSDEKQFIADGFSFNGYEVILDVGIDNKINVTENISVNFSERGYHGIYKFTPTWLEYTGKDGKTIKRKSNIINYRAEGNKYIVVNSSSKPKIKIGNENYTVYGKKEYTIKYTYDMGKDPFDGCN